MDYKFICFFLFLIEVVSNESKVDGKYGGWVMLRVLESDDVICVIYLFFVDFCYVNIMWLILLLLELGGIYYVSVSV